MSFDFECWTIRVGSELPSIEPISPHLFDNADNRLSPRQCYQTIYEISRGAEQIWYVHNDVDIYDDQWPYRVSGLMSRPNVGVVGLGGAVCLAHPDLYKRPYRLSDMARSGYASNQTDWGVHGQRETEIRPVAVVDAFFMAVKTSLLDRAGGWPHELTHHCLDLWVCCEAARQGLEVWMVGATCTHRGGGTSTRKEYSDAKWLQGGTVQEDHERPHRWLYEQYRDVLPIDVRKIEIDVRKTA